MNNGLLRLAFIVNTDHSQFIDNVADIVTYMVATSYGAEGLSIEDIQQRIENCLYITFSREEIESGVKRAIQKDYLVGIENHCFQITEIGNKKVEQKPIDEFDALIHRYIEEQNVLLEYDKIQDLLYRFLFSCIDRNVTSLVKLISSKKDSNIQHVSDIKNDDEKKIVNAFLDWNDEEKDRLLIKLVNFSVDYCRLTVKKDKSSFNTLLNGKVFYLDANIIFRLMGINKDYRKKSTEQFINKCKEVQIKLLYTSVTKKEVFETIDHYVNTIQRTFMNYHGRGGAISNLVANGYANRDFYLFYNSWAKDNSSFGRFVDFKKYLRQLFHEVTRGMVCENISGLKKDNDLVSALSEFKSSYGTKSSSEYDIENVLFIERKRGEKNLFETWNQKYYLISADQRLIDWIDAEYSPGNAIAVLPSVFFSVILKVSGRSTDDYKSYVEFLKYRLAQTADNTENIEKVIGSVCNITNDGMLQDLLFDMICEQNTTNEALSLIQPDNVESYIENQYGLLCEKLKDEGYNSGLKEAQREIREQYKDGFERGSERSELLEQKNRIHEECIKRAKWKRNMRIIAIIFVSIVFCGALIYLQYRLELDYDAVIKVGGSVIASGILGFIVKHAYPIEFERIYNDELLMRDVDIKRIDQRIEQIRVPNKGESEESKI